MTEEHDTCLFYCYKTSKKANVKLEIAANFAICLTSKCIGKMKAMEYCHECSPYEIQ